MTENPEDDRSHTAKAMAKVSELMAICLMMTVPGLIGYYIDQQIGTKFLLMLLGFAFGMFGSIIQLIKLANPPKSTKNAKR